MAEILKMLIAEGNPELRQALADALSGNFRIETCADGLQAKHFLQCFRPDFLVLDLMLTQFDSITLLQQIAAFEYRPMVVVTTRFASDYVLDALQKLPVDYVVNKPCHVVCVADRIRELADFGTVSTDAGPQPADTVRDMLMALDFSTKVDGFSYLICAIPLYARDPNQNITKELYAAVGSRFHKSGGQVERSIRSAIHSAWERRDNRLWRSYLPSSPDGQVPRPTNGEFISRMAILLCAEDKNLREA